MTNVLQVNQQQTIRIVAQKGWSHRRIARELEINRRTVAHYLGVSNCTGISTAGSAVGVESNCATISTPGLQGLPQSKPPEQSGSLAGRKSQCQPLAVEIEAKMELGLSAQRIYQDLVTEHGFV